MTDIFELILNLSLSGSLVILLLLAVRLPLSKMSKKYAYWLWVLAALKLVCPVSFWPLLSRFQNVKAPVAEAVTDLAVKAVPVTGEAVTKITEAPVRHAAEQVVSETPENLTIGADIAKILTAVWAVGAILLILSVVIKAVKTARSLRGAEHVKDNIYRSYKVSSPFAFGIFRPRIYMPKELSEQDYPFLLRHEQTHVRRHDLVFKAIWIVILSIHWFNPLVWLAYRLFERDMEMSCDEEVVKLINRELRADYCSSLVNYARLSNRPKSMIVPVGFGKKDVKVRIESIMKYRELSKKTSIAAILTFTLAATGCIFSPDKKELKVELPEVKASTPATTAETTAETAAEILTETTIATAAETTVETTAAEKTDSTEILGYKDWSIKKSGVEFTDDYFNYQFVAADGTLLGYYGGTEEKYAIKDLDGDGVNELICNTEYTGDGAKRFIVFKNNNGKIQEAEEDWDTVEKILGRTLDVVGEYDTAYDYDSGKLIIIDKAKNDKTYEYDPSLLKFNPIQEN